MMDEPSDFQIAEYIKYTMGRKEAEEGVQEEAQLMQQPSLLSRVIRRLTTQPAYDGNLSQMPESDTSLGCE